MKVHLCVIGRLRGGPEQPLVEDYLSRFDRIGRGVGLLTGRVVELEDRKNGGLRVEAQLIRKALPSDVFWILDERGEAMSSPAFAAKLGAQRDQGIGDLTMVIGGADGTDPGLRSNAAAAISFGRMVWPHMLARVMLAEQLYRAASILTGNPYHRA